MKSEVAFFKDKRANTAEHIIRCYRFFGFTDKEIINEMKKIIALRKDNLKVGSEYDQTLELLEPSPSDVSVTQDVLMDIKKDDDTCPECGGCGEVAGAYYSGDGVTTCDRCNGKGTI